MAKQAEPKLREAELPEYSPWRHYTGDIRIWLGLLLIPLVLFGVAVVFHLDKTPAPAVATSCDYSAWYGKPFNLTQIRKTGQPFQFIAKGGTMPPSGDDRLLNIEVDGRTVLRVWCG